MWSRLAAVSALPSKSKALIALYCTQGGPAPECTRLHGAYCDPACLKPPCLPGKIERFFQDAESNRSLNLKVGLLWGYF